MSAPPLPPFEPLPDAHPRRSGMLRAAIIGGLGAGTAALAWWIRLPSIPLCAFKLWTGLPCPGCGMTRACVHLAHGDVLGSLRFHPLAVPLAVVAAAVFAGGVWAAFTGSDPVWRTLGRHGGRLAIGAAVLLVGVWIVRTFVVPDWAPDPIGAGHPLFAAAR